MKDDSILTEIFSLQDFTQDELDIILPNFKKKRFGKGEYLMEEGQRANHYWFVENGFIRSFAVDTEGNDVSTDFYSRKDVVIDWPSFFMRTPTPGVHTGAI